MALALEDARTIIRPLMSSIDKRAEYTASLVEGDRPGVMVTLTMRKKTTSVTVSIETLTAARKDSMRRNQLRTTLKQALDKMLFVSHTLASTKMLRPMTKSDGFFRTPMGGRGRR